ncbi:MAG TPA: CorA family divalent cation transporter [Rhodospirillales bacterium]|nr:CorA family divalent cation transporter [Rhodospirillales bacterium]
MIEVADDRGLLCGFRLTADAPAERLSWRDLEGLPDAARGPVWLHFNITDARARNWLAAADSVPQQARETLLDSTPHIGIAPAGNGLAGVLGDLHYDDAEDETGLGLVQFYVDETCLITARRHPLKALDRMRRDLIEGLRIDSPAHLLIHILEHLADAFGAVTARVLEAVDAIEDRLLAGRRAEDGGDLGRSRRMMARLRRQMTAERHALLGLGQRLPDWWSKPDRSRLRQAVERLDAIAQDLELVQERARLLQEELADRQREATRSNLYFLSVLSAIFLPLTLVTGVFGMNVPQLPWEENPHGFWWVMLAMAITLAIVLAVLRWRRLF